MKKLTERQEKYLRDFSAPTNKKTWLKLSQNEINAGKARRRIEELNEDKLFKAELWTF